MAKKKELKKRIKKAMEIIPDGSFDGGHHKMWVIDQILRALTGCPIICKTATNYKGEPFTYEAQGESEEYKEWLAEFADGEDGPHTYNWDIGIAP